MSNWRYRLFEALRWPITISTLSDLRHWHLRQLIAAVRTMYEMRELWESLNNRELALVFWGSVFAVSGVIVARTHLKPLLKAFLAPRVCGVFAALAVYLIGTVLVLESLRLWDASLLKDTIVWFFTVGCVTLFQASKAGEKPHLFRDLVLDSLKLTVVIEFVRDTFVLPLGWEMLLVPVITLIACMSIIADNRKEHRILRKPLKAILGILGFGLVAFAFYQLYLAFNDFATWTTAKEFMLEPALTFLAVPFFFLFALSVNLEGHFIRLRFWLDEKPELLRIAKWQALLATHLSLRRLARLKGEYYVKLRDATDKMAVTQLTREFANKPEPRQLKGEVVRTRIVPFILPANGQQAQKVLIDWKNLSDIPAGAAFADIVAYDADGDELLSGAKDYCIFSYDGTEESKVKPGSVYVESEAGGFILFSDANGAADRVEIRLTRLLES